jgi:hypothetical protein
MEREIDTCCKTCFQMTISDINPVQFWLNGETSFNNNAECSIYDICFCQPFNCDDEIKIQVSDDIEEDSYSLSVLDSSLVEIYSIDFEQVRDGIHQISFIPANYGICDEKIRLLILQAIVNEYNFTSGWSNESGAFSENWTFSNNMSVVLGTGQGSMIARKTITQLNNGETYRLVLDLSLSNATTVGLRIRLGTVPNTLMVVETDYNTSQKVDVEFTADRDYTILDIWAIEGGASGNNVSLDNIKIFSVDNAAAESDCIDIRENHECTKLITYSNSKDFDGVEYDTSPGLEFYLRVPAVFFIERYPKERESAELSTADYVRLRNETRAQKLFDIGYIPYYFHRKLQLVFDHDIIQIDGKNWISQEEYEIDEGNKRYPIKRATTWLTDKNYIKRNIL